MTVALDASLVSCKNWSRLREHLRNVDPGWAFRGQSDIAWDLAPTLERLVPNRSDRLMQEVSLEHGFRRHAENLLRGEPVPATRLEWLALLQHHGGATRLLDFTFSPYVAAYFAVEAGAGSDAIVWAINLPLCFKYLSGVFREHDFARGMIKIQSWTQAMIPISGVVPCIPSRANARQMIQQGVFIASGDIAESFEANLSAMAGGSALKRIVRRFHIRASWKGEILDDLRLMNITRATLFPGLDGFAKSLAMGVAGEPKEQRDQRLALWSLGELDTLT